MDKTIQPNKISSRQKKAAESLASRLKRQGVGQDEAAKEALREVADQKRTGRGGGTNSGGEAKKPTKAGRLKQRPGSDSNQQK